MARNPWKEQITFARGASVKHKVGGQELTFYPISVGMAFNLESVADILFECMTTFFSANANDQGREEIDQVDTKEGITVNTTRITPSDPEIAKYRDEQRQDAVQKFARLVVSSNARTTFGQIIMDSLRDIFDKEQVNDGRTVDEFMSEIPDLPSFMELIEGVIKANREAFDPFMKLAEKARAKVDKVMGSAGGSQESTSKDNTGQTSPTPSSSPSQEDTDSNTSSDSQSTDSTP